ncbi:MAG: ATP-binding protein [Caulobacter sp.]|nr:ATP-binding protein [Caulobacter sp.]
MLVSAQQRWRNARAALRRRIAVNAGLPDRAEDILASILNISDEGLIVVGPDLRILVFSDGAGAIFGYRPSEVLGRPLHVLVPLEHRAAHGGHMRGFAAEGGASRRMVGRQTIHGLTKTGAIIPLEVGLSKLGSGEEALYTAFIRDISDRVAAEAALTRAAASANAANDAKSAFLATMSHEIRTPLNGVLGMAQAMARDDLPARQMERLEVIRQSGETLLVILNDLLDLAKIEAGKLEIEDAEFDLVELVTASHATFAALAAQKGLDLDLRLLDRARGVYLGDPLRIRQILHNLISNAIKFTDAGSVRITAGRRAGVLNFIVKDTGIGMPPERIPDLFRKFEQVDASSTRRFGGTGLGLAICRDLVGLMGGHIAVDSRPGRGTLFRVTLPLSKIASQSRPTSPPLAAQPAANQALRILVAEDNATNQLVIRTLLSQVGIEPDVVADGQAAVSAWEDGEYDLILMDIQMPRMDGATAAGIIREREARDGLPRTPILALTANAMTHQLADYRQAGMDGHVAKPIEVDKLFHAIEAAVTPTPAGPP